MKTPSPSNYTHFSLSISHSLSLCPCLSHTCSLSLSHVRSVYLRCGRVPSLSVLPSPALTRSRPFPSLTRSVSLFLDSPSSPRSPYGPCALPLASSKFSIRSPGCFPLFEIYSQLRRRTPVRYPTSCTGVMCSSLSHSRNKYVDFVFTYECMTCRAINTTLPTRRTIKPPRQIITYRSNKYDY